MMTSFSAAQRLWCAIISVGLCVAGLGSAAAQECSLTKTNRSCTYTVDRSLPLTPPTIQMYSGQTLTVAMKNAYSFEAYSLDWVSGTSTLRPDVGSAAFTALQPSAAKMNEWAAKVHSLSDTLAIINPPKQQCDKNSIPAAGNVGISLGVIAACADDLQKLRTDATKVYSQLQMAMWPTSSPATVPVAAQQIGLPNMLGKNDQIWEVNLTCEIMGKVVSTGSAIQCPPPGTLPVDSGLITREAETSSQIAAVVNALKSSTNMDVLVASQNLQDLKALLDTVRTDLLGYGLRVNDLLANPVPQPAIVGTIPAIKPSDTMIPQVIYNVNSLNLVAVSQSNTDNSKKQLVLPITVVYGDERWEVSAGTFFSSLPIRSFSAGPIFTNDVVTDHKVTQQIVRPLVIPFAALNYRISKDLGWSKWRANFYWTGAIGINPNTVTTDFGTGPSFSYRLLMFSTLWHIGHDTRLTQGVKVGDMLGPGFGGSLPTETYWKLNSFAIGISIRTPSLTNR
jgi:hypothetical protein